MRGSVVACANTDGTIAWLWHDIAQESAVRTIAVVKVSPDSENTDSHPPLVLEQTWRNGGLGWRGCTRAWTDEMTRWPWSRVRTGGMRTRDLFYLETAKTHDTTRSSPLGQACGNVREGGCTALETTVTTTTGRSNFVRY